MTDKRTAAVRASLSSQHISDLTVTRLTFGSNQNWHTQLIPALTLTLLVLASSFSATLHSDVCDLALVVLTLDVNYRPDSITHHAADRPVLPDKERIKSFVIFYSRFQLFRCRIIFDSASAQLAMQSAVLAMIDSVRPSDRLSHAGIMPKRLQLRSCGLYCRIAPWL